MKKIYLTLTVLLSTFFSVYAQTYNYTQTGTNDPSAGTENVTIGNGAGFMLAAGSFRNVLLGRQAGMNALTLQRSILIGYRAGAGLYSAPGQIVIGDSSLAGGFGTLTLPNTIVGTRSGNGLGRLENTVILGNDILNAGNSHHSIYNVLVGSYIGQKQITSDQTLTGNTVLGANAASTLNGSFGTYVGYAAGYKGGLEYLDTYITAVGAWAGAGAGNRNNTYLGAKAGMNASSGSDNLMLGVESGYNFHQAEAIIIGKQAAYNPTNTSYIYYGGSLITIGNKSAYNYMGGRWNVFVGNEAAYRFTGIGYGSEGNTLIGSFAGRNMQSGQSNTFLGTAAGFGAESWITYGYRNNVFVGDSTGFRSASSGNTYVGSRAGANIVWGSRNIFVGKEAGMSEFNNSDNVMVGFEAGRNASSSESIMIGTGAGRQASGNSNVFIGDQAGLQTQYGNNTFVGWHVGLKNTLGQANTFLGHTAGADSETGSQNTVVGYQAGKRLKTGWGNTFIGTQTGLAKDENTGGGVQGATAIGLNAVVGVSFGVVLGDTGFVKVGIGTAYPNQRLTIRGNIGFLTAANLRLDNRPFLDVTPERLALGGSEDSLFPVEITSSLRYRVHHASQWADYVFEDGYKPVPLRETALFIRANKHLPGIPSAADVVKNGVDAAEMDARLLQKIEELTLHSIEQESRLEKLEKENAELKKLLKEIAGKLEK